MSDKPIRRPGKYDHQQVTAGQLFCCSSIKPYQPISTDHDAKFLRFMAWAEPAFPLPVPPVSDIENGTVDESITPQDVKPFVIELLRKTNFCPTEWKKYFIPTESEEGGRGFNEAKEKVIFDAMFEKTNWYQNFKCAKHNKFFEVNVYQKDPTSDVQEGADSVQLAAVAELVDAAEEPADVDESVDLAEFIEEPTETAEGFVEVAEQCADPVEEPVDFAESTDVAEEPNRTIEEPADLAEEPDNAAEELAHAVKSTHSAETAEYAKAASGTGPATTPEDAGDIEPFKVAGAARTADFVKSAAVSESGEDIENAGLLETPEFEDVAGQL